MHLSPAACCSSPYPTPPTPYTLHSLYSPISDPPQTHTDRHNINIFNIMSQQNANSIFPMLCPRCKTKQLKNQRAQASHAPQCLGGGGSLYGKYKAASNPTLAMFGGEIRRGLKRLHSTQNISTLAAVPSLRQLGAQA